MVAARESSPRICDVDTGCRFESFAFNARELGQKVRPRVFPPFPAVSPDAGFVKRPLPFCCSKGSVGPAAWKAPLAARVFNRRHHTLSYFPVSDDFCGEHCASSLAPSENDRTYLSPRFLSKLHSVLPNQYWHAFLTGAPFPGPVFVAVRLLIVQTVFSFSHGPTARKYSK